MKAAFAFVLFAVLLGLSLLHFQWARGSHWPAVSEEALARSAVGDGRRRMPGRIPCLAVSALLLAVGLWPLIALNYAGEAWAQRVSIVIGGIFAGRGVGGFTPRWRQYFYDEPFATLDRRYYSPFCIVLGLAFAAFASGDFGR
jgi:hypothetical protein